MSKIEGAGKKVIETVEKVNNDIAVLKNTLDALSEKVNKINQVLRDKDTVVPNKKDVEF